MIPLGNGTGPSSARIMIVGEVWSQSDLRANSPFSGGSGEELNKMLEEVGLSLGECFVTCVVNAAPPAGNIEAWIPKKKKEITSHMLPIRGKMCHRMVQAGLRALVEEIALVKPNVIIAVGNTALWALTGIEGVTKWRGSQLTTDIAEVEKTKVIPIIHPSMMIRDGDLRPVIVQDLRRVAREQHTREYNNIPQWRFRVHPSMDDTLMILEEIQKFLDYSKEPVWLDFDLETKHGHIDCAGISWTKQDAICIPFMSREDKRGYWATDAMEAAIVWRLYKILTHVNVKVRGQNLLYDCQYTYRHWHFVPRVAQDTMITQHTLFSGLRKSLDFNASMYCDHYVYWKDDGKVVDDTVPERQRWVYNCTDCVYTREVGEVQANVVKQLGLEGPDKFQQKMFWPVLQCMQRGVRIDKKRRAEMAVVLTDEIDAREAFFHRVLGHGLNPRSSPQMQALFYDDLKQKKNWKIRGKGMPATLTCDDKALAKIALEEPILRPFIKKIQEYRSLGVFLSTFVLAPLDIDDRMRTSYAVAGAETFRFKSSENAFGSGTNLQNIPMGGEDDEGFDLPNIRTIFIPDEGREMFDTDLSKADLRIVVWESDETEMKAMLKEGRDPYMETAREFHKKPELQKTLPNGNTNPIYTQFKSFGHGTHYLGTPHGLAQRLGLTVHEAERTQRWYFGKYPKIKKWQEEFCAKLRSHRYVENIFGFRRYYFGKMDDSTMREGIAWLPQSTVALYINHIWEKLYDQHPDIWVLLQVHDSLVGQYPIYMREECLANIRAASLITLPYDDPLIIPVGIKTSQKSWGDCK